MKMRIMKWIASATAALPGLVGAIDLAYTTSATPTPGVWCTSRTAAIAKAQSLHMPLFAFCGSPTCDYCNKFKKNALNTTTFSNWMKNRKILLAYVNKEISSASDADWKWTSQLKFGTLPACCVYWPKASGGTVYASFTGRHGKMYKANGAAATGKTMADEVIAAIESYISSWTATPPTSVFAFSTTAATVKEGASKSLSVTRTGGTAALTATVILDAASGATFDNGTLTNKISWAANATGAKSFTVKTVELPAIGSNIVAKLTLQVPASTSSVPTQNKTPTMTLTVTDAFVEDYAWVDALDDIVGDWWTDDEDILGVEVGDSETASLKIKAGATGIISVAGDAAATATANVSLGTKSCGVDADNDIEVGVNKGDVLTLTVPAGSGVRTALVKSMAFAAFAAPAIVSPVNGASFAKDAVKGDKSLVDLSWSAVTGATGYKVTVGSVTTNVAADVTSLNGIDLGAVSAEGATDTAYSWTVTAICDGGLEVGGPISASATGRFTLTVQPTFTLTLTAATLVKKVNGQISVAATGAPGITYAASSLPAGMTINASTGVISGAPTKAGTYTVTVTARSTNGHVATKKIVITVGKLPTATLKGKFYGYADNGSGILTAGYLVSINSSGKVTAKKTTISGTSRVTGTLSVSYATGAQRYLLSLDGRTWTLSGSAFVAGSSVLAKEAANGGLTSYSNLGVYDVNGVSRGYLTVKVTSGKKAKIVGYVNGVKISKSTVLAISGSTGKAYFGASGVYGGVIVTAGKGATATQVVCGGVTYTASGCTFASSLPAASLTGYKLTVGNVTTPLIVSGDKVSIASSVGKFSWKKAVGTFKGKVNGQAFAGAFAKVGGVWKGFGVTTSGAVKVVTVTK